MGFVCVCVCVCVCVILCLPEGNKYILIIYMINVPKILKVWERWNHRCIAYLRDGINLKTSETKLLGRELSGASCGN